MQPLAPELVQIDLAPKIRGPKPAWLKAKAPMGDTYHSLKKLAREQRLHTVCESAQCPNIGECWNQRAATFMMLGNLCTRRCGFCAVPKGKPGPIDRSEPARVAYAVAELGLRHAVITSVNRDDDNIGAAQQFVDVIREIHTLTAGAAAASKSSRPISRATSRPPHGPRRRARDPEPQHRDRPRLYGIAKSGGRYQRSLRFLEFAKELNPAQVTKTGIIVGLGEEMHELLAVFRDLADRRVDILTIGQYLRPSSDHLLMARFTRPTSSPSSSTKPSPWASARRERPARPLQLPRTGTGREHRAGVKRGYQ